MDDLGFTGNLARMSARRPWWTLGVWLLLLGAAVVAAGRLGDVLTEDSQLTVPTESEQADELIDAARRAAGEDTDALTEFVILESETDATVTDPAFQHLLSRVVADLSRLEPVTAVTSPLDGVEGLMTADGRAALVQATLEGEGDDADLAAPLIDVVEEADANEGFRVVAVGNGSVSNEFTDLADETLRRGETLGLPIALVVLVVVFGAVVAALIPIALAVVAIIAAIGITAMIGQLTDLNLFIVNMITMIGLAVGIDYTLFIVQRFREERQAGRRELDAVAVAGATASRAVFFSGITVVIALLGLMIMPETTMRSLGMGAIVAVAASVLAALTLLPALLGLLGDRVDRLRLPVRSADAASSHRFWNRITRVVTARPVVSMVLAGGLLIGLALPYATIEIGSNFIASLPEDSDTRHGFEVLNEDFRGGLVSTPITVSAQDVGDPDVQAATSALATSLGNDPGYGEVTVTPAAADLLVVDAVTLHDPSSMEARTAVEHLRAETIPAAFDGVEAQVRVTGDAAHTTDFVDVLNARTPIIFVVVLSASFVLLMLVFRSVIVPLKAIVMNLLSVGAAYGLLVAVFQHGWGADLFGFQQTDVIESWVPLFLFAVLFGLSMDYHVFLLSRIRERYARTHDNSGSVAFGLSATGAIITGAALIMVAVFAGFAAGDLVMFQQMGFGLAVAIILDATVVRSVLVPATMELLGDRNWYFPRWLQWLPEIHVEGPPPVETADSVDEARQPVGA